MRNARYMQTMGGDDVSNVQARGGSNYVAGSAYLLGVRTIAGAATAALYGKAGCLVQLVFLDFSLAHH
jgi:hypothetical protein